MPTVTALVKIDAQNNTGREMRDVSQGFKKLGKDLTGLGQDLAPISAAAGGILIAAVKMASTFDSKMALMKVAAKDTGASIDTLRQYALKMGADTIFSANESAEAMTGFFKAGFDATEIMGDMTGKTGLLAAAMNLSAASELDLAAASDAVAVAMATFGLSADDATKIVDNFVQTADASVTTVPMLTEALRNIGPTAAAFGFSLEDVNTALAILSSRGIEGAEAGTSLKSMMTNMMRPTDDVTNALASLNITLYDAQGNMRELPDIVSQFSSALQLGATTQMRVSALTAEQAGQLGKLQDRYVEATGKLEAYQSGQLGANLTDAQRAAKIRTLTSSMEEMQFQMAPLNELARQYTVQTRTMTEELRNQYIQTIAGTYGMKALQTLVAEGVIGWEDYEKAIAGAATAQDIADARMGTFEGAVEALKGSLETLLINVGTPFINNFLRPAVKVFTEFINKISQSSPRFFSLIGIILAVVAAAAPLLLILGTLATAIGALLSPIGLVVLALGALAVAFATNFGGIRDVVTTVLSGIPSLIEQFAPGLQAAIATIFSEIKAGDLSGALETAESWIGGMIATLSDPAKRAIWAAEISDAISGIVAIADAWVGMKFPAFQTFLHNAIATLRDPAKRAIWAAEISDAISGIIQIAAASPLGRLLAMEGEDNPIIKWLNRATDTAARWLESNAGKIGAALGAALGQILAAALGLAASARETPEETNAFDTWANRTMRRMAEALAKSMGDFDREFSNAFIKAATGGEFTVFSDWVNETFIQGPIRTIKTFLADGIAQAIGDALRATKLPNLTNIAFEMWASIFRLDPTGALLLAARAVYEFLSAIVEAVRTKMPLSPLRIGAEAMDAFLVQPLRKALESVGVELASDITSTLTDSIKSVSVQNLAAIAWEMWVSIFSLDESGAALIGLQILHDILDGVASAMKIVPITHFGGVALDNLVVKPLGDALKAKKAEIAKAAEPVGEAVGQGFETALKDTPWDDKVSALVVTPIGDALALKRAILLQRAQEMADSVPEGIMASLKTGLTTAVLGPLVDQPLRATLDATNKWVLPAGQGLGESTATSVTTGIKSNFSEGILAALIERPLSAMLGTTVTVITPQADKVGTTIAEKTGKGISGNQSKITDAMQAAMDATAAIGAESGNVANPNSVIAKLLGAWDTINSLALTAWEAIRDTILTPVAELPAKILAWFIGAPEGGESVLTKLQSIDLSAAGAGIISTLSAGLESAWAGITAWFEARKNDIQNFLNTLNALISGAPSVPSTPGGPPQSQQDMIDELRNPPPAAPPGGGRPHQAQSLIADFGGIKGATAGFADAIATMRDLATQLLALIQELLPADEALLSTVRGQIYAFRAVADAAQGFLDIIGALGKLKTIVLPDLTAFKDLIRQITHEFIALAAEFKDEKANEATGKFAQFAAGLPAPFIAIIGLVDAMKKMPKVPPDLADKLTEAARAIGIAVGAVASLKDIDWEGLAAVSEAASSVISMLQSLVDFRNALATWAEDLQGKIAPRVDVLIAVMTIVVSAFNQFAEESKAMVQPLSEAAVAFLNSVGPVFDLLESAHSLRNGIAEWAEELEGKIAPRIAVLVAVAGLVAAEFNRFADEATGWAVPLSEAAQAFLESFGETIGLLGSVLDFRNALDNWENVTSTEIWAHVRDLLDVLDVIFQLLDAAAEEAVHWVQPLSEASQAFLDSFDGALAILSSVYSFRDSLKEWADVSSTDIWQYVRQLLDVLDVIFQLLDAAAEEAVHWVQPLSDASQAFVESFGATLGILSSVHSFRNALFDWKDVTISEVWLGVRQLLDVLDAIAQLLNNAAEEAVAWVQPLSDIAQAFVESFGSVLGILQTTYAFRNALEDWSDEVKGKIWLRIEVLVSVLGFIALAFNKAVDEAESWIVPLSEAATAFVASLGAAMALLQSAAAFRNALEEWTDEVKGLVAPRVDVLVSVLGIIAAALNEAADEAAGWVKPLSETAAAFIESVGAAVGVLQSAQAFREALGDWSDEMKGKVADRVAVLVSVLGIIATELNKAALPVITDAVKAFAERVGPLTSALQGAIGLLRDLADLEIPADVEDRTIRLLVAIQEVIDAATTTLEEIMIVIEKGKELPDAVAKQLELWAARISPLATVISSTVAIVTNLVDIEIPTNLTDLTIRLLSGIQEVIDAASTTLEQIAVLLDPKGIEIPDSVAKQLELWAARISPLSSVISSTVGTLKSLADIDIPTNLADTTQALLTAIQEVLDAASTTLEQIILELDTKGLELPDDVARQLELWTARIGPLAIVISSTISTLKNLVEIDIPTNLTDNTIRLLVAIQEVIEAATTTLEQIAIVVEHSAEIPDAVARQLELWAARIGPLSTVITSTIGTLKDLASVKVPAAIKDRTIQLMVAVQDVLDAATTTLEEIIPLLDEHGVALPDDVARQLELWAARMAALNSVITSTVSILKDFADIKIPVNVGDRTISILVAVQDIIDNAQTTLEYLMVELDPEGVELPDEVAQQFERWAARIGPLATIMRGAMDAIKALTDIPIARTGLYEAVRRLLGDVQTIVRATNDALEQIGNAWDEDWVDVIRVKFERWAARLSPLASAISSAVGALKSLIGMALPGDPRALAAILFAKIMVVVDVAKEMLPMIATSTQGIDAVETKLSLWAARIQAISTIIGSGVSALESLSKYTSGAIRHIDAFIADLVVVTERLDQAISGQISKDLQTAGERLATVFGGVTAAISGLQAMAGYRRLLPVWVSRFIEDIKGVLSRLGTIQISKDISERMASLGETLGIVPTIVQSLNSLIGYHALLPAWINAFIHDIRAVLQAVGNISGFTEGSMLGQRFGQGFREGFNAKVNGLLSILSSLNVSIEGQVKGQLFGENFLLGWSTTVSDSLLGVFTGINFYQAGGAQARVFVENFLLTWQDNLRQFLLIPFLGIDFYRDGGARARVFFENFYLTWRDLLRSFLLVPIAQSDFYREGEARAQVFFMTFFGKWSELIHNFFLSVFTSIDFYQEGGARARIFAENFLLTWRDLIRGFLLNVFASINFYQAGFTRGQSFADGFLAAWNSRIFNGLVLPGSSLASPSGILGATGNAYYFYAPVTVTTNATNLATLLEQITAAAQQG